MNNEQKELLNEAYDKYTTKYIGYDDVPSKELFLFEIKTNPEFSERWGLKIEERELDRLERIYLGVNSGLKLKGITSNFEHEGLEELNIPTKLITVTYKEQTIESYE